MPYDVEIRKVTFRLVPATEVTFWSIFFGEKIHKSDCSIRVSRSFVVAVRFGCHSLYLLISNQTTSQITAWNCPV